MDPTKQIDYTNGEITVHWKPNVCEHAAECVKRLGQVFQPKERPWIKIHAASSEELKQAIDHCPSGALSYTSHNDPATTITTAPTAINIVNNGPIRLSGNFVITDGNGEEIEVKNKASLCRCGASAKKPFCDGTHKKIGFEG